VVLPSPSFTVRRIGLMFNVKALTPRKSVSYAPNDSFAMAKTVACCCSHVGSVECQRCCESSYNYAASNIREGRMSSSGILRRVTLVRTDVSEDRNASIINVARIGELGTKLAVTSNRSVFLCRACRLLFTTNVVPSSSILVILMMEALRPCKRAWSAIGVFPMRYEHHLRIRL
jgi:hypothetical protein